MNSKKIDWFLCADGGGGIALMKDKASQREYVEKLFKDNQELTQRDINKICDKLMFMRICMDSLTSSFDDLVQELPIARNDTSSLAQIANYEDLKSE